MLSGTLTIRALQCGAAPTPNNNNNEDDQNEEEDARERALRLYFKRNIEALAEKTRGWLAEMEGAEEEEEEDVGGKRATEMVRGAVGRYLSGRGGRGV